MPKRAATRLYDALEAMGVLARYVEGRTFDEFDADRGLQLIVERSLEIIGEAFNYALRSDESIVETFPEAHKIIGMRNRIIHGYDEIANEVIWQAAVTNVPLLAERVVRFLRSEGLEV